MSSRYDNPLYAHTHYTDARNYERVVCTESPDGFSLQIEAQAAGSGVRHKLSDKLVGIVQQAILDHVTLLGPVVYPADAAAFEKARLMFYERFEDLGDGRFQAPDGRGVFVAPRERMAETPPGWAFVELEPTV